MAVEGLVTLVRSVFGEGPVAFDEVKKLTGYSSDGGTGVALGVLEVRGVIGHVDDGCFVLKRHATREASRPSAYQPVLDSLRQQGSGTFQEISTRIGERRQSEVGFALGWLFGEGKIIDGKKQGKWCWCLAED